MRNYPCSASVAPMTRLLLALVLLLSAAAPAAAASDIEAVWSFSGGQVAVQAQPDGTFVGTVIRPTTLATCAHPTGEQMWTGIAAQMTSPTGWLHCENVVTRTTVPAKVPSGWAWTATWPPLNDHTPSTSAS